jgi:hypothetical protein
MKLKYYLLLFVYTFLFGFSMLLILRSGVMFLSYYNHGYWGLKDGEIIIGVRMSIVAAIAITLAAYIFKSIDEYNARKKKPTDPNE